MRGDTRNYPAWAEIDLKAIGDNYKMLRKIARQGAKPSRPPFIPSARPEILPVVKAEAYGHGMLEVAGTLKKAGQRFFCVSDITEGIVLRKAGIAKDILLFETTLPEAARDIVRYRLTPSVCSLSLAAALDRHARLAGRKINIHVNVDTGMGRLGTSYGEAHDFIRKLARYPRLSIQGIYTHLPVADSRSGFTRTQIRQIYDLFRRLHEEDLAVPYLHAANSMGLAGYRQAVFNLARPGLMLYGLYPVARLRRKLRLRPAMSVKTRVIFVRKVRKGQGISYGHTFVAPRPMTIATLSIGYSDGYLRGLSNKADVLIRGRRCPVVGRVTMDQIMADASKVKSLTPGMVATVMGAEGRERISAEELAGHAGTINYEIACAFGNQLPRVYRP